MFYKISKMLVCPLLRAFFRVETEGKIPKKGGYIIASNHESFLDHFIFPCLIKRKIVYMAKSELFESRMGNFLFTNWGQIPVYRGKKDKEAFKAAIRVLEKGGLFGIFPEGTRSPTGELFKGHTGVARIAMITGKPVIPIGMINTFEAMPKGRVFPRFKKVRVKIGKPMDFSIYQGMQNDRQMCRDVTDTIMRAIGELTGEEYNPEKGYMDPKVMPDEAEGKK